MPLAHAGRNSSGAGETQNGTCQSTDGGAAYDGTPRSRVIRIPNTAEGDEFAVQVFVELMWREGEGVRGGGDGEQREGHGAG